MAEKPKIGILNKLKYFPYFSNRIIHTEYVNEAVKQGF